MTHAGQLGCYCTCFNIFCLFSIAHFGFSDVGHFQDGKKRTLLLEDIGKDCDILATISKYQIGKQTIKSSRFFEADDAVVLLCLTCNHKPELSINANTHF